MVALAARMAASPLYSILGVRLVSASAGEAVVAVSCDDRHANLDRAVHGGIVALLADTAMGLAVRTEIDDDWMNATLDLRLDFPASAGVGETLTAVGRVTDRSRRFRWADAEVRTGDRVVGRGRSLNLVRSGAEP